MSAVQMIIMGVGGVGKSALTRRYIHNDWKEGYNPTVEDKHTTTMDIDGTAIQIELLDTAGQEEFSALRQTFMHKGDGFILTFSITNDTTMEDLKKIRDDVLKVHQNKQVPMLLVGNKCDLSSERAVTAGEAKRVAQEWGCEYIETSAKANINVDKLFETIVRNILKSDPTKGGGGGG
eukprot:CAMPEP_0197666460 /NCGR_PEP_ID=MMETSP1338-20131121/62575_1 /TAXON_ID=43686 ORGANISM="Pelagodinium beii, Strain RCC1491" /NCGR_SAMPLE_ID=MMETSP1338 /ASSEMBLY_ACC=CAM_ASM_000754 /LENGTH=177 /DNA_ID=CAMNT_0043245485 /DNA_START=12 /DNA_END=541 /DNA_ORIENTATION=-